MDVDTRPNHPVIIKIQILSAIDLKPLTLQILSTCTSDDHQAIDLFVHILSYTPLNIVNTVCY